MKIMEGLLMFLLLSLLPWTYIAHTVRVGLITQPVVTCWVETKRNSGKFRIGIVVPFYLSYTVLTEGIYGSQEAVGDMGFKILFLSVCLTCVILHK